MEVVHKLNKADMFYNFFFFFLFPKTSQFVCTALKSVKNNKSIQKLKGALLLWILMKLCYRLELHNNFAANWKHSVDSTLLVRMAVAVLSSTNKPNTDTYLFDMKMLWGTVAVWLWTPSIQVTPSTQCLDMLDSCPATVYSHHIFFLSLPHVIRSLCIHIRMYSSTSPKS